MSNLTRVVANPPRTHAIEFCLFISITAVIAIAILSSTGEAVVSLYTIIADALVAAAL